MSCKNTFNVCAIQGIDFALDVGLTPSYAEVIENPGAFEVVMTFLDGDIEILQIFADLEPYEGPALGVRLAAHLRADPTETSTLPEGKSNHTVDLVSKFSVGPRQRLFEGNVQVRT